MARITLPETFRTSAATVRSFFREKWRCFTFDRACLLGGLILWAFTLWYQQSQIDELKAQARPTLYFELDGAFQAKLNSDGEWRFENRRRDEPTITGLQAFGYPTLRNYGVGTAVGVTIRWESAVGTESAAGLLTAKQLSHDEVASVLKIPKFALPDGETAVRGGVVINYSDTIGNLYTDRWTFVASPFVKGTGAIGDPPTLSVIELRFELQDAH